MKDYIPKHEVMTRINWVHNDAKRMVSSMPNQQDFMKMEHEFKEKFIKFKNTVETTILNQKYDLETKLCKITNSKYIEGA